VLMRRADAMDVQKSRCQQRARSRLGGGRSCAEEFHVQPAFFTDFAQGSLLRIFVQLDMPAQREPLVERPMVDEQYLCLLDNKDRDSEIDLVVNMRHHVSPCTPQSSRSARQVLRRGLVKYK